jgi:hypothetical protein
MVGVTEFELDSFVADLAGFLMPAAEAMIDTQVRCAI